MFSILSIVVLCVVIIIFRLKHFTCSTFTRRALTRREEIESDLYVEDGAFQGLNNLHTL